MREITDAVRGLRPQTEAFLCELMRFPSTPGNERDAMEYVARRFAEVGAVVASTRGSAKELAHRLNGVLALTGTPRPVTKPSPKPLGIDTTAVFHELGRSGKASGK